MGRAHKFGMLTRCSDGIRGRRRLGGQTSIKPCEEETINIDIKTTSV